MRIVQLTTDNREAFREYEKEMPWFGAAPKALLQGFARIPEVEVHVVTCTQRPMVSPERLAPNIFFHSLHVPKLGWLRTAYQGCVRAIRRELRKIQPAIVHGQGTERECTLSAALSGFPNVATIHGNMAELSRLHGARPFSFDWLAARLENWSLPRTGGVFCNSRYTERLVKPRNPNTWLVPNPLRQELFDLPPGDRAEAPTILNIGVISPRKRQVEILQMAHRLNQQGTVCHFQFVGLCGESDEYGRQFRAELSIAAKGGYANWVGTKGATEVIGLLDASRAVLHFPFEEAFGLVAAEALARNAKFFGAKTGGIIDIAAGAESVELYDVDDWAGLEAGIREWIKAGAGCPTSCADLMRTRYEPERIARRHLEIYQEVINKR